MLQVKPWLVRRDVVRGSHSTSGDYQMLMKATKEPVLSGTKGEKVLLRNGFDGNQSMKIWESQ